MANKDNVVGAPTEGLGQEVTYGYDTDPQGVPTLRPNQLPVARTEAANLVNAVEGGYSRTDADTSGADRLFKLVGTLAQPMIEQARKARFVQGMQRAAAGEGVAEIVRDQPWYATVFGDTDVIEGARAYTSARQVSDMSASFDASLGENSKLSPQEAQEFYQGELNKRLTGDAPTDAAIMGAFARQIPTVMKAQAKAHYGFLQARAGEAESKAFTASADALQGMGQKFADGLYTAEDLAIAKAQVVVDGMPADGRNMDDWVKNRTNDIIAVAQGGKFHAVNAIREMGGIDALPEESRTKIEAAVRAGESFAALNNKMPYVQDIAKLSFKQKHGLITGEEVQSVMGTMNADYAKRTGSRKPLFSDDEIVGAGVDAMGSMYRAQKSEQADAQAATRRVMDAQDKLAADASYVRSVATGIDTGSLDPSTSAGDQVKGWEVLRGKYAGNPEGLLNVQFARYSEFNGVTDKTVADRNSRVLGAAAASGNPEAIEQGYLTWKAYRDKSPGFAAAYTGEANSKRMELYHNLRGSGSPAELAMAFKAAWSGDPKSRAPTKEEREGRAKELKSLTTYFLPEGWMDGDAVAHATVKGERKAISSDNVDLSPMMQASLMNAIGDRVSGWEAAGNQEPVKAALEQTLHAGDVSILGGVVVANSIPGQKPLAQYLADAGVPTTTTNKAIKEYLSEQAAAGGDEFEDISSVVRTADKHGQARFTAFLSSGNVLAFTSGQLADYVKARRTKAVAAGRGALDAIKTAWTTVPVALP